MDYFNNIDYVAALCTALDIVVSTKTTVTLISAAVGTLTKLAKINPDLIIIPSYTDDIHGLNRITTSAKMLSIQNFAYVAMVGMVSNKNIDNLKDVYAVSQALFTSPQQKEFPLDHLVKAKFNQEDMISYSFDVSKLHSQKNNAAAFPNNNPNINKGIEIKALKI